MWYLFALYISRKIFSFIKRCDAKMTNCHSHISKTHWTQSYWIPNALHLGSCMGNWISQHSRSSLFSAAKSMDCSERIRISHLCCSQSCLVYWRGTKQENLTESALRERWLDALQWRWLFQTVNHLFAIFAMNLQRILSKDASPPCSDFDPSLGLKWLSSGSSATSR